MPNGSSLYTLISKKVFKKSCHFEVVKFRGYLSFTASTIFKFLNSEALFCNKPVHVGTVGSRSDPQHLQRFLITFSRRTAPPHPPKRTPNMNENRNRHRMFGSLRSPPPAANVNRASSTAWRWIVATWGKAWRCVRMMSGLLHSRS
jgi:hypothetical protein